MSFAQKLDLGRARIASDRVALTNTKHVGWHLAWVLRANFFLTDCRLIVVDQHDTIKASSVFIICPTITSLGNQFIDSRCLSGFRVVCFNGTVVFYCPQSDTPCKVNRQLSDKGMKFVQTTSDGGKVGPAVGGGSLSIGPVSFSLCQDYSGVEEGDVCRPQKGMARSNRPICIFFWWIFVGKPWFWKAKMGTDTYIAEYKIHKSYMQLCCTNL